MKHHTLLKQTWTRQQQIWGKQEMNLPKPIAGDGIAVMFAPGPFYYYIFSVAQNMFEEVYPTAKDILPIGEGRYTLEEFTRLIHPDDVSHMMNSEDMVRDFLTTKIAPKHMGDYKISYAYRVKTRAGYQLMLHQARCLTPGEQGGISKIFVVHTSMEHLMEVNNYKMSFLGLHGLPSYVGIPAQKRFVLTDTVVHPFSDRELEIIRLLADGQSNKMIAEVLFISPETVRTHRKNILEKSRCDNSLQLVAHCIRNGIV